METKGRGFSVIEILIVMGVLGVIAVVFTIQKNLEEEKKRNVNVNVENV